MRSDVVMASPHGHHSPYENEVPTVGLAKMSCPARKPPGRSARSRSAGEAFAIVTDVHSLVSTAATVERALASISTLNDEVTHVKRVSQLHPRAGQPARRFLSA